MRIYQLLLAIAVVFSACATSNAATAIREAESGTITGASTIDTLGLFGPAGASLAGKAVTIYMKYVPGDFPAPIECRNNACTDTHTLIPTSGATVISIAVDGKRIISTSSQYGQVLFSQLPQNYFYIYTNTTDFGIGYAGVRVGTAFTAPVTFGSPLSPENPPVLGTNIDQIEFFTADNELPSEILNFSLSAAE